MQTGWPALRPHAVWLQRGCRRLLFGRRALWTLIYGAEKSSAPGNNLAVVESFLARLVVMDYDRRAAEHTGQLRAELQKHGTPIGPYDQMIAGHARGLGLVVVTNNEREFTRVPGIRIENWTN